MFGLTIPLIEFEIYDNVYQCSKKKKVTRNSPLSMYIILSNFHPIKIHWYVMAS